MRILLCVAGPSPLKPVISFAGIIARATGSEVTLLHVIRRREEEPSGKQVLGLAQEMLSDLMVEARIRQGDPVGMILAEIQEGDYDLVAIGARREVSLAPLLLGSVALQVIRRAPTSVLVVGHARDDLKRILICTGGSAIANPIIETGAWLARAAEAQATLLHVTSAVPSMYTGLGEIEETLSELLQTDTPLARHLRQGAKVLAHHQVTAGLELRHGVPAGEILLEADQGDYDLIVLGASGAGGRLRGWLLGDVTREVVERAPCPVLVVRQVAAADESTRPSPEGRTSKP